ncbi:MAG: GlsB/YeaQ/YmgE family stress response membrane protein [Nocardioides sp.]
MGSILATLVGGAIIGLLGKFVAPGNRDNIPLWLTVFCGIGGSLIGYFIYSAFGGDGSSGVDWTRWIVSVLVAAGLVMLAATYTAKRNS